MQPLPERDRLERDQLVRVPSPVLLLEQAMAAAGVVRCWTPVPWMAQVPEPARVSASQRRFPSVWGQVSGLASVQDSALVRRQSTALAAACLVSMPLVLEQASVLGRAAEQQRSVRQEPSGLIAAIRPAVVQGRLPAAPGLVVMGRAEPGPSEHWRQGMRAFRSVVRHYHRDDRGAEAVDR